MARIEQLIGAMTLSEKLGQLTMTAAPYAITGPFVAGDLSEGIKSGAVGNLLNLYGPEVVAKTQRLAVEESRLRIPLLIGLDVIHGHRTLFPVPLGEAAMFDPALWEKTAREAAREAAADGVAMTFAPMCDVARDPRWGRMVEGPGEDPFVGAAIARAKVAGFQGALGDTGTVAACAKHFAGYGAVMAGREYASTDISERTLHEVHLPAFAAAVEAGVASVMPAFTELGGVPMTAHKTLLTDYLRGELGFKGVIISDYNAIAELIPHGVAADIAEAAALALNAGVDIDMMAGAYAGGLPLALERGLVTMDQINAAVRRVLTLKEQLGLFDDPCRGAGAESAEVVTRRRALAREAAVKSVVLLKNDNDVLPLSKPRRVALIGPLADAAAQMRGSWAAAAPMEDCVTILEGLRAALPDADIQYAPGVTIEGEGSIDEEGSGIAEAAALCDGADAIILCVGEAENMSGEAASRAHPHLPGAQQILCDAVFAKAGGKPVISILFSGRPLVVPVLAEKSAALLAAWFPGAEAGHALADLLTGARSPSGRTPVSWPRATGQIPIFFGERRGGRPFKAEEHYTSKYLDTPNTPLFAFGHGLSYGRFVFSNLRLSGTTLTQSGTLTVSIDVTNDGARAAEETVFLFVHDKVASVTGPLLELKGFAKIALQPSARGTVTLTLKGADLCFSGPDLKPVFEAGAVEILVGPSAERDRLVVGPITLLK